MRPLSLLAVQVLVLAFCEEVIGRQLLVIEPEKHYQTMDGFGASDAWRTQFVGANWPEEKKVQIADWLFSKETDDKGNPKGIGLSMWRFYIGAGSTEQGDSSGIKNEWRRAECFLNPDGTYDWTKQQGQKWFLSAAKERGVESFLAFSIAAPTFLSLNGKGYSVKNDPRINVKPGKLNDYARFLVEVVKYFKQQDIRFNYLSPFNEPQWDWSKASQEGTAATNEDIYLFTRYLSNLLEENKLDTELTLGEAGSIEYLYDNHDSESQGNQIETFFDTQSPLYVGGLSNVKQLITGHSYFTTWPTSKLIETRAGLRNKLDQYKGLDYWQTEFCILEKSPEIGSGQERDLGMATALYVARVIHSDLTIANASSWQWWTALTTYDFKDGLIYLDTGNPNDLFNREKMKSDGAIHDSKLMWAFGNFSRFIRPGMQRVNAFFKNDTEVKLSAYTSGLDEATVVMLNDSQKSERILLGDHYVFSDLYITDEKRNLEHYEVKENSIEIPPRSVVTVIGKLNGK
ncbi:glycoside hydrolase family 30 protein [Echinicola sediminis]